MATALSMLAMTATKALPHASSMLSLMDIRFLIYFLAMIAMPITTLLLE